MKILSRKTKAVHVYGWLRKPKWLSTGIPLDTFCFLIIYGVPHTRPQYLKSGSHTAIIHPSTIYVIFFWTSYTFPKIHTRVETIMHFLQICICYKCFCSSMSAAALSYFCLGNTAGLGMILHYMFKSCNVIILRYSPFSPASPLNPSVYFLPFVSARTCKYNPLRQLSKYLPLLRLFVLSIKFFLQFISCFLPSLDLFCVKKEGHIFNP